MTKLFLKLKEFIKNLFATKEAAVETKPLPEKPKYNLVLDNTYQMKTVGDFKAGGPKGIVVHFTAGQCSKEQDAVDSIKWGINEGLAFWMIAPSGKIYKTHSELKWGYHAGVSYWPSLGNSVSQDLIGIEMANAGMLTKQADGTFKSWFNKTYPADQVRYSNKVDNIQEGYYLKYTPEQEEALVQVIFYLKRKYPMFSFDLVLGHDEVAPTRKNDPGAALSMSMPKFREYLKNRFLTEQM